MKNKKLLTMLLLGVVTLSGCGKGGNSSEVPGSSEIPGSSEKPVSSEVVDTKKYTYSLYDAGSPNTWNPHEWETNTDSVIIGYTEMGLYDFVLNDEGDGYEVVPEMAESFPVDVSDTLTDAERARYGVGKDAEAVKWTIDLNPSAKWADGTPINADDYIYSMEQLLSPEMLNRRADSFYSGTLTIGNAKAFRYGGLKSYVTLAEEGESIDGKEYFSLFEYLPEFEDTIAGYYDEYGEGYFPLGVAALEAGTYGSPSFPLPVEVTDENRAGIIEILDEFAALFGKSYEEFKEILLLKATGVNEKIDFDGANKAVGLVKSGEYQITLYLAAGITDFFIKYNLSSNWIVKKDLYEAGKRTVNNLTKTTYGTAIDNYMGYGPYKLSNYQKDKLISLTKNDKWYGWKDGKHVGQFQTTDIRIQIVPQHATALAMFEKGEIDEIGLQSADMSKYINSSNLLYTPESYTRKVTMSTDWPTLAKRQSDGINKTILTNVKFREAFSWALDREDFTQTLTSGSMPFLAPINNLYVSDPDTGVAYRDTDQGKAVIESIFGNNETGYNLSKAKDLLTQAYNEELASEKEGSLKAGDKVKLTFWVYGEDAIYGQYASFLDSALKAAAVGTPLEGKIEVEKQVDPDYSDRMQAGGADMCFSTWGGATMDPFGIMQVYTDPKLKYEYGFDAEKEKLTLTINGVEETHAWYDWNFELNDGDGKYHSTKADAKTRLDILAGMEKALIEKWLFVSVYAYSNSSLFSKKIEYATYDYVNLVGYGGIRFMTYNYDDTEWTAYVKSQGGTLDYTK